MDERQIGGDDLVRALAAWAAEQRVAEAATSRVRERSLREQAGASATWAGVLVDLAEQGARVAVTLVVGRRVGRLVGVGPDFCIMEQGNGRPAIVALSAITSVSLARSGGGVGGSAGGSGGGGSDSPAGDRAPALELSLAAALGSLADERTPVVVSFGPGETVEGDLTAVGRDVLTVRSAPRVVYVPLAAVMVCELR